MRHRWAHRKLGRTTEHRRALLRNLATALFQHERITTTLPKAKELRSYAEKLITRARRDTVHDRRLVARELRDRTLVRHLFDEIAPRYAGRPGGYTRIVRLMTRRGDGAEMAIIELVEAGATSKEKPRRKRRPEASAEPAAAAPAGDEAPAGESGAGDGKDSAGEPSTADDADVGEDKAGSGE